MVIKYRVRKLDIGSDKKDALCIIFLYMKLFVDRFQQLNTRIPKTAKTTKLIPLKVAVLLKKKKKT